MYIQPFLKRIITLLLLCPVPAAFVHGMEKMDPVEKVLLERVDTRYASALVLLEKIVNINSGTMNFTGVKQVHDTLAPEFAALGFQVRWQDGSSWGRAGHFIATRDGRGSKLLLIGHLDTVFEQDSPFQKYEKIDDNTARGPGIADMKGGIIIMLLALQALHDAGSLQQMNITIILTGDEEKSGSPLAKSKGDLVAAARWADYAIGFENADGDPATAIVARRGSTGWTLKVRGVRAHSSQIFTDGIGTGAILEASRILDRFYTALTSWHNLTFNPGIFVGGTDVGYDKEANTGRAFGKTNVVAQDAIVSGGIRAVSRDQLARAQETMQAIVAENRPDTTAVLEFSEGYPPLAPTAANHALLEMFSTVSADLGYGKVTAVNPRDAGAADVSFTAGHVTATIDGLGPGGAHGHSVNEYARLDTLQVQAKRAAVFIYRLQNTR